MKQKTLIPRLAKRGAKLYYQVWLDTKLDADNKDNIQSVSIS